MRARQAGMLHLMEISISCAFVNANSINRSIVVVLVIFDQHQVIFNQHLHNTLSRHHQSMISADMNNVVDNFPLLFRDGIQLCFYLKPLCMVTFSANGFSRKFTSLDNKIEIISQTSEEKRTQTTCNRRGPTIGLKFEMILRFDRSPRAKVAEQRLCPKDTGSMSCRLVVVDLEALKAPKMKVSSTSFYT